MYVCVDCNGLFTTPKHYVEKHGLENSPYEERDGCPFCGGAFVEAKECKCCGQYINDRYIKTNDDEYICRNCYIEYFIGDEEY